MRYWIHRHWDHVQTLHWAEVRRFPWPIVAVAMPLIAGTVLFFMLKYGWIHLYLMHQIRGGW